MSSLRQLAPTGDKHSVQFLKAGFLARGDEPELYFFRVDAREVVLGVSGSALRELPQERRFLSREKKIDVAGLALKKRLEMGEPLEAERMYVRENELIRLGQELGLDW